MLSEIGRLVLEQVLSRAGAWVEGWTEGTPISRAIRRVARSYNRIPDIAPALARWSERPGFHRALYQLTEGTGDPDRERLASELIEAGFSDEEQTPDLARQVADTFLSVLDEELLDESGAYAARVKLRAIEGVGRGVAQAEHALSELVHRQHQELLGRMVSMEDILADRGGVDALNRQIDRARDLLVEGRARTARTLLEAIRGERGAEAPALQFRILTNLACCEVQLGATQRASELFEAAYALQPTEPKAKANRAFARLLLGEVDQAIAMARQVAAEHPHDPTALSVLAEGLKRKGQHDEAIGLLRSVDDPGEGVLEQLAELELARGHVEEAVATLERIGARPSTSLVLLRADARLKAIETHRRTVSPFPWQIPERLRDAAAASELELDGVIEQGGAEQPRAYIAARAIRGYLRASQERYEEACHDLWEIIGDPELAPDVTANLAALEMIRGRPADAVRALMRLDEGRWSARLWALMAEAYIESERLEDARASAERAIEVSHGDSERAEAVALLAEVLCREGRTDEALQRLERLRADLGESAEILSRLAEIYLKRGDAERAIDLASRAVEIAIGARKGLAQLRLAEIAFRARRFDIAVAHYRPLVSTYSITEGLRRLVIALYESRDYAEALGLARDARARHGAVQTITEIEGAILEHLGELDEAAQLYARMLAENVAPRRAAVRLAIVEYRRGNVDAIAGILERALPLVRDDAHGLMAVGHLFMATRRHRDALTHGYRALGLASGEADMYLKYAVVVHAVGAANDEDLDLDPTTVALDTAVTLEVDAEERTYIIVSDAECGLWPDEIRASSALARALMGKSVGETVGLPTTPVGRPVATVRAIRSKYVARYQEVMAEYNARFPEAQGLWRIRADDPVAMACRLADQRAARVRAALDGYERGPLTVGSVAHVVGSSIIETWLAMLAMPAVKPLVHTGSRETVEAALQALNSTGVLVLEATAAVTLFALGQLQDLEGLVTVCVGQSTVDLLTSLIDERRFITSGRVLTIYEEGGRYYRQELTPEEGQQAVERLVALRDSLRRFNVVGRPAASRIEQDREVRTTLGEETVDSIEIAQERGAVLVTDDVKLAMTARSEWSITSVSSYDLLVHLVATGRLGQEALDRATITMVDWGFRSISVRPSTLLLAARDAGYSLSPSLNRLLEVLADEGVDLNSAVGVATKFLRDLWLLPVLAPGVRAITDATVVSLVRQRGLGMLARFRASVNRVLRFAEAARRGILAIVDDVERRGGGTLIVP